MEGRAYTQVARHIAALIQRAPILGRVTTVIDGTGVGRAFTDLTREAGVAFTPVTITAGGSQTRGERGYVAKSILLSELAAQLETATHRPVGDGSGANCRAFPPSRSTTRRAAT